MSLKVPKTANGNAIAVGYTGRLKYTSTGKITYGRRGRYMSDDSKLAANVSFLAISRVGTALFNGIFLVLVARAVSVESYGFISFVLTLVVFGVTFSDAGMSQAVTRDVAVETDEGKISRIATTAFLLKVAGVLLVSFVTVFGTILLNQGIFGTEQSLYGAIVAAFIVAGFGLAKTFAAVCRGFNKIQYETGGTLFNDGLRAVIGTFAFLIGTTLQWILAVLIVGSFLRFVVPLYGMFKQKVRIVSPTTETARTIVWFGLPLGLSALGFQLLLSTDRLLIGFFSTSADLGIYQSAFTLTSFLFLIPNVLKHASYPISAGTDDDDQSAYSLILMLVVGFVFPIGLFFVINSTLVIGLVFGAAFADASIVLSILTIGILVRSLSSPVYPIMVGGKGEQVSYSAVTGMAAIINVALNVLLIPAFGLVGAAMATCMSLSLDGLGKVFLYNRRHSLAKRSLVLPSVSAIVGLSILVALKVIYFPPVPNTPNTYVISVLYIAAVTACVTVGLLTSLHYLSTEEELERVDEFLDYLPLGGLFKYYFQIGAITR